MTRSRQVQRRKRHSTTTSQHGDKPSRLGAAPAPKSGRRQGIGAEPSVALSTAAAARVARAARLGHRVDRLPMPGPNPRAAGVRADSSPSTVRRYTTETLTAELAKIKASTDSAENLLAVNATAQTNLNADGEADNKKLTPYMTSLGFEVEFAQQSNTVPDGQDAGGVVLRDNPGNLLDNAHIKVATSGGLSMYPDLEFLLETDAGRALEFVTPPLLAPLEDSTEGAADVIPDLTWQKAATRALEFGIKDRVEQPTTIEAFVDRLNTDWPVQLDFTDAGFKNHVYGPIRKEGKATHTNAQVNYMTTLRHYAEINMSGVGGKDVETERVLNLLWTNGLSDKYDADTEQEKVDALRAYSFVVSQKLREIPGAFNDYIFSVVLDADSNPPQAASRKPGEGHLRLVQDHDQR